MLLRQKLDPFDPREIGSLMVLIVVSFDQDAQGIDETTRGSLKAAIGDAIDADVRDS
jgi:hypothetical protein